MWVGQVLKKATCSTPRFPRAPSCGLSPARLARRDPEGRAGSRPLTLLGHLPLLADPQHFECFLLGAQGDALDVRLQGHSAQLRAVVEVVHPQLPQAANGSGQNGPQGPVSPGAALEPWAGAQDSSSPDHCGTRTQTGAGMVPAPTAPAHREGHPLCPWVVLPVMSKQPRGVLQQEELSHVGAEAGTERT